MAVWEQLGPIQVPVMLADEVEIVTLETAQQAVAAAEARGAAAERERIQRELLVGMRELWDTPHAESVTDLGKAFRRLVDRICLPPAPPSPAQRHPAAGVEKGEREGPGGEEQAAQLGSLRVGGQEVDAKADDHSEDGNDGGEHVQQADAESVPAGPRFGERLLEWIEERSLWLNRWPQVKGGLVSLAIAIDQDAEEQARDLRSADPGFLRAQVEEAVERLCYGPHRY